MNDTIGFVILLSDILFMLLYVYRPIPYFTIIQFVSFRYPLLPVWIRLRKLSGLTILGIPLRFRGKGAKLVAGNQSSAFI